MGRDFLLGGILVGADSISARNNRREAENNGRRSHRPLPSCILVGAIHESPAKQKPSDKSEGLGCC